MYKLSNLLFTLLLLFLFSPFSMGQTPPNSSRASERLWLDSEIAHQGDYQWKMIKAGDATTYHVILARGLDVTINNVYKPGKSLVVGMTAAVNR